MKSNRCWIPWPLKDRMPTLGDTIDAGVLGKAKILACAFRMDITQRDDEGRERARIYGGPEVEIIFPLN